MTKQHSVVAATLVAACIVVAVTAGEQNQGDRFAGVELTAAPVAGKVHMVQGRGGGNVGVFAGPDGVLLVDSLFAPCPTDWSPRCELFQTARFAS